MTLRDIGNENALDLQGTAELSCVVSARASGIINDASSLVLTHQKENKVPEFTNSLIQLSAWQAVLDNLYFNIQYYCRQMQDFSMGNHR